MSAPLARSLNRRSLLTLGSGALLALAGCASPESAGAKKLGPLPSSPSSRSAALSIGASTTQVQLSADPSLGPLPFNVTWVQLGGGPDTIQGFRAGAVDLASNAGMPPIQAHDIGFDAKIVAISQNTAVTYVPTTRPGSDIRTAKDVVGKKIGFSQGQAQGVTILKWLKENGISYQDVTLVPLPSSQFLTALQAKQVDVAPLTEPALTKYLYPTDWGSSIAWEQTVADLMSGAGFVKRFDVSVLFDRRFEHIAAQAAPTEYRGQI